MMLHAAGEANQMQRGLPGFKDLKDSKCEEKAGQDGKGADLHPHCSSLMLLMCNVSMCLAILDLS